MQVFAMGNPKTLIPPWKPEERAIIVELLGGAITAEEAATKAGLSLQEITALRQRYVTESEAVAQQARPPAARAGRRKPVGHLLISVVLLCVVVGLVITFASGVLRFGLEGPFIYVMYVLAGLLTAFLCYGVLDSVGELTGSPYGIALKLGGPIVGLVVVAAGGALYEKNVRGEGKFSVRIYFYEKSKTDLAPCKGELAVHLNSYSMSVHLDGSGTAFVQDLSPAWKMKSVGISLVSLTHSIEDESGTIVLNPEQATYVRVHKKPTFESGKEASVNLDLVHAISQKLPSDFAFRSVNLEVSARAETGLPVPIDKSAILQIQHSSGLGFREIDLSVTAGSTAHGAILEPQLPTTLYLEGELHADAAALLDKGYLAQIVLRYDRTLDREGKSFLSMPFEFSKSTVKFEGD